MTALFTLAIGVLLLNHWLCTRTPVRQGQSALQATTLFSAVSLALMPPLTWFVAEIMMTSAQLIALRSIALVLVIAVIGQLAVRILVSRIELDSRAIEVLCQRTLLNCSVLAITLLHTQLLTTLGEALLLGAGVGVGFEFALYAFTLLDTRLARAPLPTPFRGMPITLISAGLMALALMGLKGLF